MESALYSRGLAVREQLMEDDYVEDRISLRQLHKRFQELETGLVGDNVLNRSMSRCTCDGTPSRD